MKTPWGAMLRTAAMLGVGVEPFWRLSLKEWRMLVETSGTAPSLGRDALVRMTEAWPDD